MKHVVSIDPRLEWKKGLGWFCRRAGIAWSVVVDLAGAAAGWLWLDWHWGVLILAGGGGFVGVMWTIRYFWLQRMETDALLHQFSHGTRDDVAEILRRMRGGDGWDDRLRGFHGQTTERIAGFFRRLTGERSVNCAIRLAERAKNGKDVYVTKGRSSGMDPSRESRSEPIPSDRGLAHALREKGRVGVYLIDDIGAAVEAGSWLKTANDDLHDVQKLMVAPINGWENGEKVMLGILYVTSAEKGFSARHTEAMKAFADSLGLCYPLLIDTARVAAGGQDGK